MKKNLIKKIKQYDVISFDLFDTLVSRNIGKPSDVFKLVEDAYKKEKNKSNCNFYIDRIDAEKKLSEDNNNLISLDDIYNELHKKYKQDEINYLKAKEIEIEKNCIVKNKVGFEIYNFAKELGKTIILVSDMYINTTEIKSITKALGFEFDEIFVSCDIKKSKSNRKIYSYLKNIYKGKKILHIGDNFKSDVLKAKLSNIGAYYLKNKSKKTFNSLEDGVINKLIINNLMKTNIEKFGYEFFGPLLVGFSKWIKYNNLNNYPILFLSRDGQIMKKAYDILYPNNNSHYFYASRKSLIIPRFYKDSSYEKIFEYFFWGKLITIKQVLQKINCLDNDTIEIINKNGFNINKVYKKNELVKNKDFKKIYEKYLKSKIFNISKNQYNLLKEYLNNYSSTSFLLIDIGWFGNMQKSLQILFEDFTFEGLYMGTLCEKKEFSGYLFDIKNSLKKYYKEHSFNALFEDFFMADHGSVIGYEKGYEGSVVPIEDVYNKSNYSLIFKMQEAALQFVSDYYELLKYSLDDNFKNKKFYEIINYCNKMPRFLINEFKSLTFEDYDTNSLISFKNNKVNIKKSTWKVGAFKLKFGIDIGYMYSKLFSIYYKLRRKK